MYLENARHLFCMCEFFSKNVAARVILLILRLSVLYLSIKLCICREFSDPNK